MAEPAIPPYAPTAYASTRRPTTNLDQEVKLHTTVKQRELYESLAEIHSIIVTLDYLEKGFTRLDQSWRLYPDMSSPYRPIQWNTENDAVTKEFSSLDEFQKRYGVDYELGIARLKVGIPVTVEQSIGNTTESKTVSNEPNPVNSDSSKQIRGGAKAIAEVTGNFITCMDAVKLNFRAKDQLHPLLSELITSLNRVTGNEFAGRGKLVQWLIILNKLKINEEITEEESRQLLFDLDSAYKEFYTGLE